MDKYCFPKAVALVVFNRLDCVQEQMKVLKHVTPPRLYIISDGPRRERTGEDRLVNNVRKYIEKNVTWDCNLIKIYADDNMGCDQRSVSGYNEVFQREEEAVLLEDDSIPNIDFYRYAEKMLDYYKDTPEVMMVSGFNVAPEWGGENKAYYFSYFPVKCAWATWRRAWQQFDSWKYMYQKWDDKCLYDMLPRRIANIMRGRILANYNGWSGWDSIWDFLMFYNKAYGVIPADNYVQNIGFGRSDAFHPAEFCPLLSKPYGNFPKCFSYRSSVVWDKKYDFYQSELRFVEGCDKNWRRFYLREQLLRFAKKYFPKRLYKSISILKQTILRIAGK